MFDRRCFLKSSLVAGVSTLTIHPPAPAENATQPRPLAAEPYDLSRHVATRLFDGERCFSHPRAGIVPAAGDHGAPRVVMTMNTMHLAGSDVFRAMFGLETNDLGARWTPARAIQALAPHRESIAGVERPVAVSDFWPGWHEASKTLLGTGHTVAYTRQWKVTLPRPRHTAYATYDAVTSDWSTWQKLKMPAGPKFEDSGAGCTQRYDLPDGSLLLPIYFRPPHKNSQVTVARCTFDGKKLQFEEHGTELGIDDDSRGLHEPSLTRLDDTFFLTIRNDNRGFVTRSQDGLQFEPLQPWRFDDDSELGNYNTQQHWVTHRNALFLVYNRRGADNDHVFRHRAPLFMAQVDPLRLRVMRATEQILVPERGARLGNFGVTNVNADQTWVTVAEWMQPKGVEKYGSDGSVHVAQIHWAS